jgi:hypothetical protein
MKKFLLLVLSVTLGTVTLSAKKVTVEVYPTTAELWHKGQVVPTTTPGVYDITVSIVDLHYQVRADGYDMASFIINLKSQSPLKIHLKPNRKTISIATEPNNASISVDGKLLGKGSVDFTINKYETKTVIVEQEGYDTYVKRISFDDQSDINMFYNLVLEQNRREFNVMIDVPSAEFLVDNVSKAKGTNRASFFVEKGKDVNLVIKADGYYDYQRNISFYDEESSLNLTQDLIEDKAYTNSIPGTDIANKDIIIAVNTEKVTEEIALHRLSYYLSEKVGELRDRDNLMGFYSTIWVKQQFGNKTIRTRATLKKIPDDGSGELKFKLKIESQKAETLNPTEEDYKPWERVLSIYKDLPSELINRVQ